MSLEDLINSMPFAELLGIEVTEVADGHARAHLPVDDHLRSSSEGDVVHGGATYALADTAGGAAVVSLSRDVSPTVDMRIDYLAPVTDDIYATADVIRYGSNLSMVQVQIHDEDDTRVATAQGTYKTGGQGDGTPWDSSEHREAGDTPGRNRDDTDEGSDTDGDATER
jgi:uncharacterized protein (TIGR00369 family)